jgi:hypothetical protein
MPGLAPGFSVFSSMISADGFSGGEILISGVKFHAARSPHKPRHGRPRGRRQKVFS